jgi:aryl-alcohol dehydrogenase-like predicted oxidoreductase
MEAHMADLPRATLGRTGLEVTRLGFGAMELRGAPRGPDVDEATVERLLNAVLDSGINLIDTSPDYGVSEERIGRYISHRRDEFILASKCGCAVTYEPGPDGPRHRFTRENIVAAVERSLQRMKTDHIDIVQFHSSPSREDLEEHGAVEVLQDLQREGKIRFIGMSGTLPNLRDHLAMGVFDEYQIPYSALQRDHERIIEQAAEAGAGTVIRGGAAKGAPSDEKPWDVGRTGSAAGGPNDPFKTGNAERWWSESRLDDLLDGMSRMEFTLRFTLSHPSLHTTIVGTSNPAHLESNVQAAAAGPLPPDMYEEAKRRLEAAGARPE